MISVLPCSKCYVTSHLLGILATKKIEALEKWIQEFEDHRQKGKLSLAW